MSTDDEGNYPRLSTDGHGHGEGNFSRISTDGHGHVQGNFSRIIPADSHSHGFIVQGNFTRIPPDGHVHGHGEINYSRMSMAGQGHGENNFSRIPTDGHGHGEVTYSRVPTDGHAEVSYSRISPPDGHIHGEGTFSRRMSTEGHGEAHYSRRMSTEESYDEGHEGTFTKSVLVEETFARRTSADDVHGHGDENFSRRISTDGQGDGDGTSSQLDPSEGTFSRKMSTDGQDEEGALSKLDPAEGTFSRRMSTDGNDDDTFSKLDPAEGTFSRIQKGEGVISRKTSTDGVGAIAKRVSTDDDDEDAFFTKAAETQTQQTCEAVTKVTKRAFACANCEEEVSAGGFGVTELMVYDEVKDTWLSVPLIDVIPKVLNVKPSKALSDLSLELCTTCGNHLSQLYKFYELFVDLRTLDSNISCIIKGKTRSRKSSISKRKRTPSKPKTTPVSQPSKSKKYNLRDIVPAKRKHIKESESEEEEEEEENEDDDDWSDHNPMDDLVIKMEEPEAEVTAESSGSGGRKTKPKVRAGIEADMDPWLMFNANANQPTSRDGLSAQSDDADDPEPLIATDGFDSMGLAHPIAGTLPPPKRKRIRVRTGPRSKPNPTDCPICAKKLNSKSYLRVHLETVHLKMRPFRCPSCDKCLATRGALAVHMQSHAGAAGKTALCSICGKTFATKGNLKAHFEMHFSSVRMKEPKHRCDLCGKALHTPQALRKHRNTHSDLRNFTCEICGNAYRTNYELRRHQPYHLPEEERPHKCRFCGRGFPRKASLKDHLISGAHNLSLDEAKIEAGIGTNKIAIVDND